MKTSDLPIKLAFSIEEAVAASGVGRTFEEIKAGRLVARKCGRRTLILKHDLALWLDALPRSVEVPD
ncbi:MAG: DNA-binding protein [Bradyrhizobium sp.]|nr:MAG: DNA-binding protein [Bradyrhizobium sp.]